MELSYCVVNTNGRDYLLKCLAAIYGTHPAGVDYEVLVLDNASDDGSAEAVEERFPDVRILASGRRAGLAENNTWLLSEAQGRFCLLLNEDSELLPGATQLLLDTLRADPRAAAAGAQLILPTGKRIGCSWRLPSLGTAIAGALYLDRLLIVQTGKKTREVGAVQSASMLVRREAAQEVDYFDSDYFLYFEEIDFQARMHAAGWTILHVPAARTIHHQQITNDRSPGKGRVVEFQRMRDLYMRKHYSPAVARITRVLSASKYLGHAHPGVAHPGPGLGLVLAACAPGTAARAGARNAGACGGLQPRAPGSQPTQRLSCLGPQRERAQTTGQGPLRLASRRGGPGQGAFIRPAQTLRSPDYAEAEDRGGVQRGNKVRSACRQKRHEAWTTSNRQSRRQGRRSATSSPASPRPAPPPGPNGSAGGTRCCAGCSDSPTSSRSSAPSCSASTCSARTTSA